MTSTIETHEGAHIIESKSTDTIAELIDSTIDNAKLLDTKSEKPEKLQKTKKKKVIKKEPKSDQDDYIQKLMEAEIPKTTLEKYEKIELESDIKPKIEIKPISLPTPVVIKKEKKPIQTIEPVVEELEPIKLKPRKPKIADKETIVEPIITRKLKSRITQVQYPPNALNLVITDINATRQCADLSRTIEEIPETTKTKTKKFKPLRKHSTELEKPELEVYEKYVSDEDEPSERSKYKRPSIEHKEENIEQKTLKLGKGKTKAPVELEPEIVKLKKIPAKQQELEVETVQIPKKGESSIEKIVPEKIDITINIDKFIPTDIYSSEVSLQQYETPDLLPEAEPAPEIKPKKTTRKTKSKPEPETIPAQLVPGVPQPKEISPEKDVSFKYQQKPKPDEPVETIQLKPFVKPVEKQYEEPQDITDQTMSLPKSEITEPIVEQIKLKKKKIKKEQEPEESTNITLQLKSQDQSTPGIVGIDEHVDYVIKPTRKITETQEVSHDLCLPRLTHPTEGSADESLTLAQTEISQPEEIVSIEEIKIKKRKQKVPDETEPIVELVIQQKSSNVENISQQIILPSSTPLSKDSADAVLTIEQPELDQPQEAMIKIKKKKASKVKDVDMVLIKRPIDVEPIEEDFTICHPSTSQPISEDVEQEYTIQQPSSVEPDLALENITVKKVKKIKKPTTVSVKETVEIEAVSPDDLYEVNVKLSQPTAYAEEKIDIEETITQPREEEEPEDHVTQEFTIKKKTAKKPTPVIEEHDDEFTIKKLKKKQRVIEVPGYTDTENVTFRPRSTKTKEDVEQEFKIQLDSYAEEEVSMSGKIKLKKLRPKTYSEEVGEAHIRITEEYDDGEGPIIEEIIEDSEPEDTMYDVEEPEEYSDIEELPKEVEFKLKTKKPTPEYKVEEFDEEDVSIHTVKPKKKQQVTYDVDSLTLKKQPKRKPSTCLEGYYLSAVPTIIITSIFCKINTFVQAYLIITPTTC